VKAYPDDYVYSYRYAKVLAQQGKHDAALPLYEQSMAKVYGSNRLRTAELYARSLQALNRTAEARKVLAEALKASGASAFAEDAARLKALLQQLPPAAT
jgi:predicted negative regulator of RcsB-dependent stress response